MKRPSRGFIIALGIVAIIGFSAFYAMPSAPIVVPQNSTDQGVATTVAQADYIVQGKVTKLREFSKSIGGKERTFHAATVRLSRVLKGKLLFRRSLEVWVNTRIVGSPRFQKDEEVVLLLIQAETQDERYLTPYGGAAGIRRCGQDRCKSVVSTITSILDR